MSETTGAMAVTNGARTLDRGLALLDELAHAQRGMGVTELAHRCGLDKSTAHRMLATLVARGYARQDSRTREYALGMRIFALYDALQGYLGIQEICRPLLTELMELSGETAHLAVLSGSEIVFVDWVDTEQVVGVRTVIGRGEPAHCTALGRAMLAALPETDRDALLEQARFEAYTDKTLVTREALVRELEETARRGYALDNEEFLLGVRCLAAVVRNRAGLPAGAIGISGPATRLSLAKCQELGVSVGAIAGKASALLGYAASND